MAAYSDELQNKVRHALFDSGCAKFLFDDKNEIIEKDRIQQIEMYKCILMNAKSYRFYAPELPYAFERPQLNGNHNICVIENIKSKKIEEALNTNNLSEKDINCPISLDLLENPVLAIPKQRKKGNNYSAHTYSSDSLSEWIKQKQSVQKRPRDPLSHQFIEERKAGKKGFINDVVSLVVAGVVSGKEIDKNEIENLHNFSDSPFGEKKSYSGKFTEALHAVSPGFCCSRGH